MEQKSSLEAYVPISAKSSKMTIAILSLGVWVVGFLRILWIGLIGRETALGDMSKLDLDSDLTLPSWYSSLLLALCALLLFLIAMSVRARGQRDALKWGLLALIFVVLSMDEAIAIHEMSLEPIRNAFDFPAIFTFGWIPFAIALIVVLAIVYVPFLLRLPRPLAVGMLAAAVIYVFGVIGMGMVNGALFSALDQQKNLLFSLSSSIEEALEILGLTLLIMVLIDHLAMSRPPLIFRIADK